MIFVYVEAQNLKTKNRVDGLQCVHTKLWLELIGDLLVCAASVFTAAAYERVAFGHPSVKLAGWVAVYKSP